MKTKVYRGTFFSFHHFFFYKGQTLFILSVLLLLLLLFQSAYANNNDYAANFEKLFGSPTEAEKKASIERLEALLKDKSLSTFRRQSIQSSIYQTKAIGSAVLGEYGEIVFIDQLNDYNELSFLILPDGKGGLEFVCRRLLPEKKQVYARVSAKGKIKYADDKGAKTHWKLGRPRIMPFEAKSNGRAIPGFGVVLSRSGEKKEWVGVAPKNSEGWCCRLAKGGLWFSDIETPPIENCIWAVRRADQGIDLRYAGPLENGLYASIGPDCSVEKLPDGFSLKEGIKHYWPLKTVRGTPGLKPKCFLGFNSQEPPFATLHQDGSISFPGIPIE